MSGTFERSPRADGGNDGARGMAAGPGAALAAATAATAAAGMGGTEAGCSGAVRTVPRGPEPRSAGAGDAPADSGSCAVCGIVFKIVAASPTVAEPFILTTMAVMLS